ncbi:hypothetical protein LCGC14_1540580 [marine sediment metagenome]|uniref:Uncharacterized protein n=1 Tax=marine sediment metagenome TaxID=412755 RepID=A0A0F9LTY6_9ZZZZ
MSTQVVQIGEVGVDSGQLMLCDPSYIGSQWSERDWEDMDVNLNEPSQESQFDGEFSYVGCCVSRQVEGMAGQLNYRLGHAGAGVVTNTGLGDGCYPVYAEIEDMGTWGRRVVKIWVDFMGEEDEDDA